MSDDRTPPGGPPEVPGADDEPRTVFMPGGPGQHLPAPAAPAWQAPDVPPEPTPPAPSAWGAPEAPPAAPAWSAEPTPAPVAPPPPPEAERPGTANTYMPTSMSGFQTQFAPREVGQGIQVGDVLNHIFEVRRFIARGGMGEVFEGINVNTDERVAIKVMLPALAADPNVIGMFRKEARTLTRLNHEALVSYRVLAQEPQLGVLYIVTEYVDGVNLADNLGAQQPTSADLALLLRRLASGLRVAHQLGAIHRDIAPDNVILEDGELGRAKVIDFGIAKDLDPGSKTIVGDGFAGKLNYVAPEQLGDFGREVGPWTDVYSLALVILAVALGKNVQMGGSLVDAVDKRRAGPDLSAVPDEIRPVLDKMLKPNPADRLRSMDEVLAELEPKIALVGADAPKSKVPLFAGLGIGAAVLAAAGFFAFGTREDPAGPGARPGVTIAAADPIETARSTVNSTLPQVACTWLNIVKIEKAGNRIVLALTGVAGNPASAQSAISRALEAQKITNADINFEAVSNITQSGCAALDAFRQIRSTDSNRLTSPQHKYEMKIQPPDSAYPGESAANEIINIALSDPTQDFALIGIEPSGVLTDIVASRRAFEALGQPAVSKVGEGKYRMQIMVDHADWSGYLLLTGKGPFPKTMIAPGLASRGPDWLEQFVSAAARQGWQADMVWVKSVDEVPG